MKQFYDLFKDEVESPQNPAEGVPQDTLFSYISSSYLNGLINYVDPIKSYMVERNTKIEGDIATDEYLDERGFVREPISISESIKKAFGLHTELEKLPDDVVVLGESQNSYWFFHFDHDVSDCEVGRISKNGVSREEYVAMFENTFTLCTNKPVLIELPELKGHVSFF